VDHNQQPYGRQAKIQSSESTELAETNSLASFSSADFDGTRTWYAVSMISVASTDTLAGIQPINSTAAELRVAVEAFAGDLVEVRRSAAYGRTQLQFLGNGTC